MLQHNQRELPPIPKVPDGFTIDIAGPSCTIQHARKGMGCMNMFLCVWLAIWTVANIFLIFGYFNGGKMEGGQPIPLWFVLAFAGSWVAVACLLLYLLFTRKTFLLDENGLRVDTRLLFWKWSLLLPRDTITEIKQVKDGGGGEDSFPSWGLKIKAAPQKEAIAQQLSQLNHWGRKERFVTVLFRLPYEHSEWLGIVIAHWTDAELKLCPKP